MSMRAVGSFLCDACMRTVFKDTLQSAFHLIPFGSGGTFSVLDRGGGENWSGLRDRMTVSALGSFVALRAKTDKPKLRIK